MRGSVGPEGKPGVSSLAGVDCACTQVTRLVKETMGKRAKGSRGETGGGRQGAAKALEQLLEKVERQLLDEKEVKASVADFIRLVQLQKEFEEERPREVIVRWVEPSEGGDALAA